MKDNENQRGPAIRPMILYAVKRIACSWSYLTMYESLS